MGDTTGTHQDLHTERGSRKGEHRYESPLRAFSRKALVDTEIAGTAIPAGARVLVMYASANRDERGWDAPDTFDIRRDATRHLSFGQGTHACAGQGLARLETTAMLRALAKRVERIELTGPRCGRSTTSSGDTTDCR
jgi:cytochrome P450